MAVRQLVAVTIAVVCSLGTSAGQEDPVLPAISNWSAPPYWSPALDGKVAKAPPGSPGSLGAEAVEVLPSPPMPFVAVNPCRIADTRGNGFSGQAGPPALLSNATRTFQIGGTVVGVPTQCGIPLTAQAVSFQFTVIQPSSAGNLIAWPSGPTPTISVLNWEAGIFAIGNGIVVPVSDTGGINVFVNAPFGASAQLTIDVNGYYAPLGIVNTLNGLSGAVTLSAGSNVTITPAGNTLTIAATGSAANWSLTGNSGTTPGTNFLGTTDNQSLVIKVNNQRVLQLVPGLVGSPSVIGGHSSNFAFPDAATISGGGYSGFPNLVTDPGGTVGGGANNQAGDGLSGFPFTEYATVSGGYGNTASGLGATVPGGSLNTAQGKYSFAAGYRAKALNDGSFVWADSNDLDFEPPMALGFANSFHVRATGGAYFVSGLLPTTGVVLNPGSGSWSSLSDTAGKENFRIVDGHDVLARLADVRIQTWNYKTQPSTTRHIGPMAQDFRRAFEVGEDERYISTVDADGVALAAIQAVYEIVKQRDGEIAELKARLSKLEASRK